MLDDVVGYYFTRRDLLAISKKRSQSFEFTRHKKLKPPERRLIVRRNKSWAAPEDHERKQLQAERYEIAVDGVDTSSDEQPVNSADQVVSSDDQDDGRLTPAAIQETNKMIISEHSDLERISKEIEARSSN